MFLRRRNTPQLYTPQVNIHLLSFPLSETPYQLRIEEQTELFGSSENHLTTMS